MDDMNSGRPEAPEYDGPEEYSPAPDESVGPGETAGKHRKGGKAPKAPKPRKKKNVFKMFLNDVILTGVILCIFAMFHHVIPRIQAKNAAAPTGTVIATPTPAATSEPETAAQPAETSAPEESADAGTDAETASGTDAEPTPEPTPEVTPEPEELTWAEKFADRFTDEVVVTDDSYTSSTISVTVSKIRTDYTDVAQSDIYVADIYVADINALQTCFASGSLSYYSYESALSLADRSDAVIAVNADYADAYQAGFVVRNGVEYYNEITTEDICVIYYDGSVETCHGGSYDPADIELKSPYQSFKFGPILVENGEACTSFNTTNELEWENPRTAFGYYEPGHYCLVVVDGRQSSSRGLEMDRLAEFMESLGVQSAYNLDGGASSVMVFNGKIISSPSNGGRDLGDIILVTDTSEDKKGES